MEQLAACCIPVAAGNLVGTAAHSPAGGAEEVAVAAEAALPDGAIATFVSLGRNIPAAVAAATVGATPLRCCGQHEAALGMAVADMAVEVGTLPAAADLAGHRHCNAGAWPSVPSRPTPLFQPGSSELLDRCAVPALVRMS